MSDLYEAGTDPYCYPASEVLRNKLDIRDPKLLEEVEALYSQKRLTDLYTSPLVTGRFGFRHLARIHHYVFQDLYLWAGKIRTVRIHKGRTSFAYPEHIATEAARIFEKLRQERFLRGLSLPVLLERLSWYVGELNVLHPFREGNGRALRAWLRQLGLYNGLLLHFEQLEPEEWLQASIAAYTGDLRPMYGLLSRIAEPVK